MLGEFLHLVTTNAGAFFYQLLRKSLPTGTQRVQNVTSWRHPRLLRMLHRSHSLCCVLSLSASWHLWSACYVSVFSYSFNKVCYTESTMYVPFLFIWITLTPCYVVIWRSLLPLDPTFTLLIPMGMLAWLFFEGSWLSGERPFGLWWRVLLSVPHHCCEYHVCLVDSCLISGHFLCSA